MTIGELSRLVAKISTDFEENNTELKKEYLLKNIYLYNQLAWKLSNVVGTFGTGYPYYALRGTLEGALPIIEEQIRYNNELVESGKESSDKEWPCQECLEKNYEFMPDLKVICKPCQKIDNSIKPRKVINRLPDLDMWTIAEDRKTSEVSAQLARVLQVSDIYPSDIKPYQTILEFIDTSKDIREGRMPSKFLPIDTHIVEVSQLKNLIEKVPETIRNAKRTNTKPFLNIHPLSYRKTWQYDDTGYNFIFDFLFSFNIFTQNKALLDAIKKSRITIAKENTPEELISIIHSISNPSVQRRMETIEIQEALKERFTSWQSREKVLQKVDKADYEE